MWGSLTLTAIIHGSSMPLLARGLTCFVGGQVVEEGEEGSGKGEREVID